MEFLTWHTNINRATINELKEKIITNYPLTEDIESTTIAIIVDDEKRIITDDSDLQATLNVFLAQKIKKFTVSLEQCTYVHLILASFVRAVFLIITMLYFN